MYQFYPKSKAGKPMRANVHRRRSYIKEAYLTMLFVAFSLIVFAQNITLKETNAPLKKVFLAISNQSGFEFLASSAAFEASKPVTITVVNQPVNAVLETIFKTQPLIYEIKEKIVVITEKAPQQTTNGTNKSIIDPKSIKGTVKDSTGTGLAGATIKIKGTNKASVTNKSGDFLIDANLGQELEISFIGYNTKSVLVSSNNSIEVVLQMSPSKLNEIQIIGYGTTTKRLNTGSQSSISAATIENQPVTNVFSALSGRMPGVFIQTTNGLPGGNINIQIRGKGSLVAGTNPLYVIDGVPFDGGSYGTSNQYSTSIVSGVISPLNSINPSDIANITILKDADATAIYGSRGTNGVVLIETKRGRAGDTRASISISQGISQAASQPTFLSTADYLQIRREAFANDKLTPTITNAPDLLVWDQSQYADWPKYLFGNTASATDVQASINGGDAKNSFTASANFHNEGNIIAKAAQYTRGGAHFNFNHKSSDQKFGLRLTTSYITDKNSSPNLENVTGSIALAPNFPMFDATGQPTRWNGNPAMDLFSTVKAQTTNLVSNLILSYAFTNDLSFKIASGYNKISTDQQRFFPLITQLSSPNYAQFNQNLNESITIEPQINYSKKLNFGELTLLAGATYQDRHVNGQSLQVSNFSNEELMENLSSAATVDSRLNIYTHYKYISVFGRATYNLLNKYIVNVTVRRDGSSRFGEGNQFGNFGSVGLAWLFGDEEWFQKTLPFVSYGKLRGSYGTTGNDQITDYQFLSTYNSSGRTYQGVATLRPARIQNDNFHWETTNKMELALELGVFKNRILFNLNYYRNRSSDQLINYTLPSTTGFISYQANLPAVIENTGLELELTTNNINKAEFNWSTSINLTVPRNRLVSFQDFANSSYAQTYEIGYDISRIKGYHFIGVDKETGSAIYGDNSGNPALTTASRNTNYTVGKTTPDFYGGISNTVTYKNFTLDFLFQFTKQMSKGAISNITGQRIGNYFPFVGDRWQQPGDETNIPRATTIADSNYGSSSANYFNSSYLRLKNVSLNYRLPINATKKLGAKQVNVFIQGQNLYTAWNDKIPLIDPEAGALAGVQAVVSPSRTIVTGLKLTF